MCGFKVSRNFLIYLSYLNIGCVWEDAEKLQIYFFGINEINYRKKNKIIVNNDKIEKDSFNN